MFPKANEEMSGGAKRSPLDLLVLPQPVDFFSKKLTKSPKISTNGRGRATSPFWRFFYFFHQLIHWMSGRTGRRISRERRESRRLFRLEVGLSAWLCGASRQARTRMLIRRQRLS
ncbi:MAG: hypothetical protein RKR03_18130 [Candidatus Competibacter sp.]|nr:hypothetical protein [Candidatus Competibacter sp.]